MTLTIVKNATCTFCGCVCDDIELHADGESAESAAANLAQALAREIEGLPEQDRREMFQRALADVRAFIETSP